MDKETVRQVVGNILEESSHTFSDVMSRLTIAQEQMLIAVAKENPAKHPTSGAFVRRNALDSPSFAQKAIAKSLDAQLITSRGRREGGTRYLTNKRTARIRNSGRSWSKTM